MSTAVVVVFVLVYVGMMLGELPGLALDRTGVALLGAIAMVVAGAVPFSQAWAAVDMPTIYLLFAMMVLSAQFRLAGFYSAVVGRMVQVELSPQAMLLLVLGVAGGMSAVLTNDIVCFAMTPVLIEGCARRRWDPVPFLLGLACAANVGSAATLIGNPQNILIGQSLQLSFRRFLVDAAVPAILGLGAIWWVIARRYRGRWQRELALPVLEPVVFSRWQSAKGIVIAGAMILAFLFVDGLPRDGVALFCAGVVLLSRRMATRDMLALVDWHLLVLFIGLFIVNRAFLESGALAATLEVVRGAGIDPAAPHWLFALSAALSNIVSNVPATMLLLPIATHDAAGPILALSSTFAGNLIVVGSIANIIVITGARQLGVSIGFRTHAATGVPVTLITLILAAGWLWLRSS